MENAKNKIKIYVNGIKKKKKDGGEFIAYRTMMKLIVEGEEDRGYQNVWVDVTFAKEIKESVDSHKGRLAIVCDCTKVQAPMKYSVRKVKQEDGTYKNVYPRVFINEIIEIEEAPRPVPQSQFSTDPEDVAIRKPHLQPKKNVLDEVEEESDF